MNGQFIIVNGFDRSGSSAITSVLAKHPKVELIMQPFNSGFIRQKMYTVLEEIDKSSYKFSFFKDLSSNKLNNDLIESQWHYKYSTTLSFKEGQLHIVKTTINHFAQKWMNQFFPEIDVWGVWREPIEIVDSIIRNNLYGRWYEKALEQIIPTVKKQELLCKEYFKFIGNLNSIPKQTAFLVAVRSHFFFYHLKPEYIINYRSFLADPNYLNFILKWYDLSEINLTNYSKKDLNVVGTYQKNKTEIKYNKDDRDFIEEIFMPLKKMVAKKHKIHD